MVILISPPTSMLVGGHGASWWRCTCKNGFFTSYKAGYGEALHLQVVHKWKGFLCKDRFITYYRFVSIQRSVQEDYYLIGAHETPFPIVETAKNITADGKINDIKVTFSRRKSLIPCSI